MAFVRLFFSLLLVFISYAVSPLLLVLVVWCTFNKLCRIYRQVSFGGTFKIYYIFSFISIGSHCAHRIETLFLRSFWILHEYSIFTFAYKQSNQRILIICEWWQPTQYIKIQSPSDLHNNSTFSMTVFYKNFCGLFRGFNWHFLRWPWFSSNSNLHQHCIIAIMWSRAFHSSNHVQKFIIAFFAKIYFSISTEFQIKSSFSLLFIFEIISTKIPLLKTILPWTRNYCYWVVDAFINGIGNIGRKFWYFQTAFDWQFNWIEKH